MKKLLLIVTLCATSSGAWAQCTGVFPNNTVCGNFSGSPAPPSAGATGNLLVGPSSTTSGDVAIWGNSTGTLLTDPGLGILNVQVYGGSGSKLTTVGNITSGFNTLTLAVPQDFRNGQWVRVNQAGLQVATSLPTSFGVVHNGTVSSSTYTYQLANVDANGGISTATASVSVTTGTSQFNVSNNNTLSWVNPVGTSNGVAIYGRTSGAMHLLSVARGVTSWTDYGSAQDVTVVVGQPDWLPATPPTSTQNDWLISRIASGGGTTTLTLNNNASNNVTAQTVSHDDTLPIKNTLAALPPNGGMVELPCGANGTGDYNISSQIGMGNGTSNVSPSSTNGMVLAGLCGNPNITGSSNGGVPGAKLHYLGFDDAIQVNGPLVGWGLSNISIDFKLPTNTTEGLQVKSGNGGKVNGLLVINPAQIGIFQTLDSSCIDSSGTNSWENIEIFMGPYLFEDAIRADGNCTTADVFQDVWKNILIIPSASALGQQTAFHIGDIDSFWFQNISVQPTTPTIKAINFDYTTGAGQFPQEVTFTHFEPYTHTIINTGVPPVIANPNRQPWNTFIDFSTINGALYPFLPQTKVVDLPRLGQFTIGAGASQLPTCTTSLIGQQFYTSDTSNPTLGSAAVGGGTSPAAVWCNGTSYTVMGK